MLRENKGVAQVEGEGLRRWFFDEYFDLIVWYDEAGKKVEGFQLCYDKKGNERALTWRANGSTDHTRVDSGEDPFHAKMTPILVADGVFETNLVHEKFMAASDSMDKDIRELVSGVIREYTI